MPETNGNGSVTLWKTVATALLTGLVGWFTHSLMEVGTIEKTTTGWSKDQEQRYLFMPTQLDSIYIIGIRIESGVYTIIANQKIIIHELQEIKRRR